MGMLGVPQETICRKILHSFRFFVIQMSTFGGFWKEMIHKSVNLSALKDKFQQEVLNVRQVLN